MKNSTTTTANVNVKNSKSLNVFEKHPNLELWEVTKRVAESAKDVSHNLGYMGFSKVNTELMLKKLLRISDNTPYEGKIAITIENLEGKPDQIENYLIDKEEGRAENKLLIGNYLVEIHNYGFVLNETNTLVKGLTELDIF